MTVEMPSAMRDMGFDRFVQRGPRVIYRWRADRESAPELHRWMWDGMEFADAEIARTSDYHRNTFGLHHFESQDEAESWLRVDGRHEPWTSCPDCAEARAVYEALFAEIDA